MYLKIDSLGHKEIMDGNPKETRDNPTIARYIARMATGDPNARAGFERYAAAYRQELIKRANAGDSSAQNEIIALDRNLPLATKIDASLLGTT